MEEKKSLIKTLIQLAKIDGTLVEREYRFLWAIASKIGLDKDTFNTVFNEDIKFTPPTDEFERIIQFHRMVLMMNVDENVCDEEMTYIKTMGVKLGLNPMAAISVLMEMKKYPNNMMPPNDLINIFKRYHN